jgi:hypothetical protein
MMDMMSGMGWSMGLVSLILLVVLVLVIAALFDDPTGARTYQHPESCSPTG